MMIAAISGGVALPALPVFLLPDGRPDGRGDEGSRQSRPAETLEGKRVLLVEDEFFVAIQIERTLQALGCATVGPFTTLDLALQASRRERFDIALLDINLNRMVVYPLADELLARGIPFVFLSGYAAHEIPETYRSLPRLQKPFDPRLVRQVLESGLASR